MSNTKTNTAQDKLAELSALTAPIMLWMREHHHPHTELVITHSTASVKELLCCVVEIPSEPTADG